MEVDSDLWWKSRYVAIGTGLRHNRGPTVLKQSQRGREARIGRSGLSVVTWWAWLLTKEHVKVKSFLCNWEANKLWFSQKLHHTQCAFAKHCIVCVRHNSAHEEFRWHLSVFCWGSHFAGSSTARGQWVKSPMMSKHGRWDLALCFHMHTCMDEGPHSDKQHIEEIAAITT